MVPIRVKHHTTWRVLTALLSVFAFLFLLPVYALFVWLPLIGFGAELAMRREAAIWCGVIAYVAGACDPG